MQRTTTYISTILLQQEEEVKDCFAKYDLVVNILFALRHILKKVT